MYKFCVHMRFLFSWVYIYPGVELFGCVVTACLNVGGAAQLFPTVAMAAVSEAPVSPHSRQRLLCLFDHGHPSGSHCGFVFHFPGGT